MNNARAVMQCGTRVPARPFCPADPAVRSQAEQRCSGKLASFSHTRQQRERPEKRDCFQTLLPTNGEVRAPSAARFVVSFDS